MRRLSEAQEVAEALSRRPWLTLSPRAVDQIAWILEQPGAKRATTLAPTRWRTMYGHPSWIQTSTFTPDGTPRRSAMERWREVEPARNIIIASTEWKIDYEGTPAELRGFVGG